MAELSEITKEQIDAASRVALCEILRDTSLWQCIRIVVSVRWGSVGRAIAQRAVGAAGGSQ